MSADKDALNAMRGVGMSAADIVKRSNQSSQQMSRSLGYIHAINGDGTMDVNVATLTDPQVLYGVRAMDSCSGSSVGDRVVLDTLNYRTYAVGTLARTDDKFVTRGEFDEVRDSLGQVVQSGTTNGWRWWKFAGGLKVCFMLNRFSCSTSPLTGGFYFGTMWSYRDLPFAMDTRGVYVTNAPGTTSDKAFSFAYETQENSTSSRVGRVNVCRWDSTAISSTAAVLVVGY